MKRTFALLLITTVLGSGSAAIAGGQGLFLLPDVGVASRAVPGATPTLIDGDEDEDSGWLWSWSGEEEEDDDEDDDECEDDDDENDCAAGATGNAAKAGTAPPPNNGLFTDGTAPEVKSN